MLIFIEIKTLLVFGTKMSLVGGTGIIVLLEILFWLVLADFAK